MQPGNLARRGRRRSEPTPSRTDHLYEAIRDRIRRAEIAPGEIIAEHEFTEEFEVSRTPVRETLRMLAVEGWLQVLPRKGYLVRPVDLADIREVMDLRIILEPELAARAAKEATTDAVAQLRDEVAAQHRPGIDLMTQVEHAAAFHFQVARLSGNRRAASVLEPLIDEVNRLHFLLPGVSDHISSETERLAHESIIDAIEARDAALARRLQFEHLEESQATMLRSF